MIKLSTNMSKNRLFGFIKMEKRTKIAYFIFISALLGIILHNLIYAIFNLEEAVFFTITSLAISAFVVYILIQTIIYLKTKKPKDWWKVIYLIIIIATIIFWIYFNTNK